jgi:hypothetical protein
LNAGGTRSCTKCGKPLAATAAFCRNCGTRYAAPKPVAPERPEPPTQQLPSATVAKPKRRWGRVALIVVAALALVAASAGGTFLLLGGSDGDDEGAEEQVAVSSLPVGDEDGPQSSGEATSGEGDSELDPQSEAEMASEIQAAFLAYYEDLVAGRYDDAWARLSDRKRRQNLAETSYRAWAKAQSTLTDYLDPSGLTVRIDGVEADGTVRVLLTGMTWSEPSSPCSEWTGLTWVKPEEGDWAYDPGYSTTPERRLAWESREDELLGVGC